MEAEWGAALGLTLCRSCTHGGLAVGLAVGLCSVLSSSALLLNLTSLNNDVSFPPHPLAAVVCTCLL
jgi:hypothetical protein